MLGITTECQSRQAGSVCASIRLLLIKPTGHWRCHISKPLGWPDHSNTHDGRGGPCFRLFLQNCVLFVVGPPCQFAPLKSLGKVRCESSRRWLSKATLTRGRVVSSKVDLVDYRLKRHESQRAMWGVVG